MIKIFSPTDKVFSSNGDIVIKATRANVHKVDNGDYYLEIEAGNEYSDYLKANNIVVVPTPQGYQAFRLEAPIEATGTKIKAKAWHVYYDSENYVIADSYVVNKNCQDALNHLNAATDITSPFTFTSNVSHVDNYRCVRKSLREAVATVLSRWGGHIVRDNYNVSIQNTIGKDNGVTIQYKKNLTGIAVKEDWSSVCTKCLPVGKDGYTLAELYVLADIQYDIPYTKVVSFDQGNINRDDYPSEEAYRAALRADLLAKANAYLNIAKYPTINYKVSANVDRITDVGDLVEVYDERLGLSLAASVVSYDYDAIQEKYTLVQFGTLGASLSDLRVSISNDINTSLAQYTADITAYLDVAVEVAVAEIWEALGAGNVIFNGSDIIVVDRLPAESAVNVMKINKNGISFSNSGVVGTFTKPWSIENVLDASKTTLQNVSLASLFGGVLALGGNYYNNRGKVEVYTEGEANPIGVIDRTGFQFITDTSDLVKIGREGFTAKDANDTSFLSVKAGEVIINGQNFLDTIRYKNGDTYEETELTIAGYINTASDKLCFSVVLPKELPSSLVAVVTELKANVRLSGGGFLFGSFEAGGHNILTDASLTVTANASDRKVNIEVSSSSPWSVTADTPAAVTLEAVELSFTSPT